MEFLPRVSAVGFFLIVKAGRLDHCLDRTGLTAQISRHTIVADGGAGQNSDVVAGLEDWLLAPAKYDAQVVDGGFQ
jgi:hypothetical protein